MRVLAFFGLALIVLSTFFIALDAVLPQSSVAEPTIYIKSIASDILWTVVALSLVLFGVFLIKEYGESDQERLGHILASIGIVVFVYFVSDIGLINTAVIVATLIGAIPVVLTKDPCKQGIWKTVTGPKGIATLLILLVLVVHGYYNKEVYRQAVKESIIVMAVGSAGESGPALDVNKIFPLEVTPEERNEILRSLERSIPNWNSLPKEEQDRILEQYIAQYIGIKEGIRNALAKSLQNTDGEDLRRAIEQEIERMPVMKSILENAHYIFALMGIGAYIFSVTVAEVVAALFAFFLRAIIPRRG